MTERQEEGEVVGWKGRQAAREQEKEVALVSTIRQRYPKPRDVRTDKLC